MRVRIRNKQTPLFDGQYAIVLHESKEGVVVRMDSGHTSFFYFGEFEELGHGWITGTADSDALEGQAWSTA